MADITLAEIENEDLLHATLRTYGKRAAACYDIIVSDYMRNFMKNREDKEKGFGMCEGYQLTCEHDDGAINNAVFLIWRDEDESKTYQCYGAENYYDGDMTMASMSLAANFMALSHLSFIAPNKESFGNAFHLLRSFVGNGCEIFTNDEIREAFKIID